MTADEIAHCLARNLFKSDLVVVDRCMWPGSECDLLVITKRLQVIDVEIKISRADLKIDREKDKWFEWLSWEKQRELEKTLGRRAERNECRVPIEWPRRVWKHYYAMPASVWRPEFVNLCNTRSGIVLVDVARPESSPRRRETMAARSPAEWHHRVVRRARPRPNYEPISGASLQSIARLASLRMWDAYWDHDRTRQATA